MTISAYDDAVGLLISAAREVLGEDAPKRGVILREATGRLAFGFDGELTTEQSQQLGRRIQEALGVFAREDRAVFSRSDAGASRILEESPRQWLSEGVDRIRLIDRRLVGVDWIAKPSTRPAVPPRFVFASLKGGVGRSTALCVAAADLARDGKNVLVVDFDIEAPGLGSLLLNPDSAPHLGTIDYLATSVVDAAADRLLPHLVAPSSLTTERGGRVDVAPSTGSSTLPENHLGKLARALLDIGPTDEPLPVRTKLERLIDGLVALNSYDVVLVDARAGLAEVTAGPLLSLNASVLLFGTAQQQTVDGYRLLFAHLASLVPPERESPWHSLAMVQAKTTPDETRNTWFRESMHSLFEEYLYEETDDFVGFNFSLEDRTGPHFPTPIGMNPLFADWDPSRSEEGLTRPFYESSFGPFLELVRRRLKSSV